MAFRPAVLRSAVRTSQIVQSKNAPGALRDAVAAGRVTLLTQALDEDVVVERAPSS